MDRTDSIDRIVFNETPVINIDLRVKANKSAAQVSLINNVINTKIKMTRDMSVMNVPLTLVTKDNSIYQRPDIHSITD